MTAWAANGQTGYINVASFNAAGEAAARYLSKGSPVAISGRLEYQQWKAQDGSARSGYTVIGHVEFLGRTQSTDAEDPDSPTDTPEVTDEDVLDSRHQPSDREGVRPGRPRSAPSDPRKAAACWRAGATFPSRASQP